ncbi:hypothetical protein O1D23_002745 [Vibrio cholerae]|nr:hypothetical protein [Vibrio cholerae]
MKDYFINHYNGVTVYTYFPTFILLSILYVVVFIHLIGGKKNLVVLGCLLWFFRAAISFLSPLMAFFPTFGDTELFSNIIASDSFPIDQSMGVKNFYYITYILRVVSFFDVQVYVLYQNFIYFISVFIIFKAFCIWYKNKGLIIGSECKIIYLLFIGMYPASIMYISVPLREFMIIFALAVFILGVVRFVVDNDNVIILLGFFLVFAIRPQLLPALLLSLYLSKYNDKWYYYMPLIIMPPFLLFLFSIVFYEITPEKLSYIRIHWSDLHGDEVYGVFEWNTWLDLLLDFPSLFLQYSLSPINILHNKDFFSMLGAGFDVLFLLPLYSIMIIALIKDWKNIAKNPFFIFFIVTLTMSSIWEAYIGGAVRHRLVSILSILPITSYYISIKYRGLLRSR